MPEQVRYWTKLTQSDIFLVWHRTKIRDTGMPMPALVSSMPMSSYAGQQARLAGHLRLLGLHLLATLRLSHGEINRLLSTNFSCHTRTPSSTTAASTAARVPSCCVEWTTTRQHSWPRQFHQHDRIKGLRPVVGVAGAEAREQERFFALLIFRREISSSKAVSWATARQIYGSIHLQS
jgi:hypothetical protein